MKKRIYMKRVEAEVCMELIHFYRVHEINKETTVNFLYDTGRKLSSRKGSQCRRKRMKRLMGREKEKEARMKKGK